jgi:hypothetical protein
MTPPTKRAAGWYWCPVCKAMRWAHTHRPYCHSCGWDMRLPRVPRTEAQEDYRRESDQLDDER